jgi:hypothetical protein
MKPRGHQLYWKCLLTSWISKWKSANPYHPTYLMNGSSFQSSSVNSKVRCVVILLNQIQIFERYMAKLVIKNEHQKDTCHNKIGLCAQNLDTILSSIVSIATGRTYVITSGERASSLWSLITFAPQLHLWHLKWHLRDLLQLLSRLVVELLCNCYPKLVVELKVPTAGPRTLVQG